MLDLVVGEAPAFLCKGGRVRNAREGIVTVFPKFGFDVLNHATKMPLGKTKKVEDGEGEGDDKVDWEKVVEDFVSRTRTQTKRRGYETTTKAASKKGRGYGNAKYEVHAAPPYRKKTGAKGCRITDIANLSAHRFAL